MLWKWSESAQNFETLIAGSVVSPVIDPSMTLKVTHVCLSLVYTIQISSNIQGIVELRTRKGSFTSYKSLDKTGVQGSTRDNFRVSSMSPISSESISQFTIEIFVSLWDGFLHSLWFSKGNTKVSNRTIEDDSLVVVLLYSYVLSMQVNQHGTVDVHSNSFLEFLNPRN
jgi:hypothetical protein